MNHYPESAPLAFKSYRGCDMVSMEDDVDDEPALTAAEAELKDRAVQRAKAVAVALLEAPPGSFWNRRLHRRPEWRPGVLH